MYDEFRTSRSVLRETVPPGPGAADGLPAGAYPLLQGLIVGHGGRAVVDTGFGFGLGAAAWGAAVKRMQSHPSQLKYLGVSRDGETARFMFTVLKRRGEFASWVRYAQVRIGEPAQVLAGVEARSADLGLVHAVGGWADTAREVEQMARVVRPGGLFLVARYATADRPPADWVAARRAVWVGGDDLLLVQAAAPGEA